ncbi:hypothetical protein WICMUC_002355 [Wickerhamomyces mucosus]|uniref:Clathrin light chain n=1 Tax=Wickerhamomyces mucosus TaxID=1378264 RepID=A0A9P8PPT6_9ASCO|nr:hypothetical protein WICMUC_002355 [Wickerhamomyces mucosus]
MADKFPEISSEVQIDQEEGDFLAREKAALGEDATEFQTDQDNEYLNEDKDDELKKFEQKFPDVEEDEQQEQIPTNGSAPNQQQQQEEEEFDKPVFNPPSTESDAVKEWRKRYELEISQRDENDAKKSKETKEAAEKQLDDFYQSYNEKKDESIEAGKKAEEEFLAKRDEFYAEGDVWSRSLGLVKDLKPNQRFKELLEAKAKTTQI